jgi:streptogramin lyase
MRHLLPRVLVSALLALGASAGTARAALTDTSGAAVPNTDAGAQLVTAPTCGGAATGNCRRLAHAATPGDDPAAALSRLWSPDGPHEDLAQALGALESAADAAAAAAARDEAIAILEGRPLAGRAYSGIPLLNWDAPRKVKTVPAGGTVDVTQVRFGDHVATDTWLLQFEDPAQPFRIRYRISELEGTYGGTLAPAPLLADGATPIGGLQSVAQPLGVRKLTTGTSEASRFTQERGLPAEGGEERTLLGVQEVVVRMPPARTVRAILEPGSGDGITAALAPATPERLAHAAAAYGFSGANPTPEERRAAIARLSARSPERQVWDALDTLDPADLAAAHAAGAQLAPLVSAMRARARIPGGIPRDPDADVVVLVQNGEAYVSRAALRLPRGGSLRVQVVNADRFARPITARSLHGGRGGLGPLEWGSFDWADLPIGEGAPATLAADDGSHTYLLRPRDDAFALWIGDPHGGDQAGTLLRLDRGPRTESIRVGEISGAKPLHSALDAAGRVWTTLSGVDAITRITPAADLAASARETYLLPGGAHTPDSTAAPLAPGDIAVDDRGIVWVTLGGGNALGRIDPQRTRDGTSEGIRVYPLENCGPRECAVPFPPDPRETVPSREPLQMDVAPDGRGGTAVWFTEAAADKIGVLRFAADGTKLDEAHIPCGCGAPGGIALDAAGDVWFTEQIDNRIGRLTPDVTHPFAAGGVRLRHHAIPSGVPTIEPELSRTEIITSVPHSVAIDRRGIVWFTESATAKLGALEPATGDIREVDVPRNEFGGEATPADLVADRGNTIYWTDEYGDQVGSVDATSATPGAWRAGRSFRPGARRSLTDSPLVTPGGDLVFVELGANLMTRVSGATAGLPAPAAPPVLEAHPGDGRLAGTGLREVARVTVTVRRGGDVVDRAEDVAVTAGAFDAALGLRAGDEVVVAQHGEHPHPDLRFAVPSITAASGDGGVSGRAVLGDRPLADGVELGGGASGRAAVDPATGMFSTTATPGTVAWAQGTPAAVYRTVVRVAAPRRQAPAEQQPAPAPATQAPEPRPQPRTPAPAPERRSAACRDKVWLAADRTVALLGLTEAQARLCAGAPDATTRTAWRYGRALELGLRGGRVVSVRLLSGTWRSADGRVRVGARRTAVLGALPGARADRAGRIRAELRAAGGARATLRAAKGRRATVGAITVTLR